MNISFMLYLHRKNRVQRDNVILRLTYRYMFLEYILFDIEKFTRQCLYGVYRFRCIK